MEKQNTQWSSDRGDGEIEMVPKGVITEILDLWAGFDEKFGILYIVCSVSHHSV